MSRKSLYCNDHVDCRVEVWKLVSMPWMMFVAMLEDVSTLAEGLLM